jgi:hypothetical protein
MADDADWAADLAERERAALIERHRLRLPPPRPSAGREPARLDRLMDDQAEAGQR